MAYRFVVVWKEKGYNQYFKYFNKLENAEMFCKTFVPPLKNIYYIFEDIS